MLERMEYSKITIKITQRAKEFLQKSEQKELYLEHFDVSLSCNPLPTTPAVRKGKPAKLERFNVYSSDGYTIYYDQSLVCKPHVTIDVHGIGIIKGLTVSDWEVNY